MALKALMAVTGLFMVLFLILHVYGVLQAFGGREVYNAYATHLHQFGVPILHYNWFLWIIGVVLLIAVLGHIYAAAHLTVRDWRARTGAGRRYQTNKGRRGNQRSYASFTLRIGGVYLGLYVIFHLLNLTAGTIHPGGATPDPYQLLLNNFKVWWVVLIYTLGMIAVGFHLRHGVWSALTTLGAHTGLKARRRLNILAYILSFGIAIGFLLVPWAIVVGVIH
ncbi:succinate dehydrogenase [Microlunatus endophyticus]|uniref:Succinate dehydrogenase n=1 Tax=Microlunatus endophyticus TaxID=1716077 RepID=A0A917SB77_9ACTN|nr:succinate dehydrogenase [Microlunatus endophyticus]